MTDEQKATLEGVATIHGRRLGSGDGHENYIEYDPDNVEPGEPFPPYPDFGLIYVDGHFTPAELEALAAFMRENPPVIDVWS